MTDIQHQSQLAPAENKFHKGNGEDGKHYWLSPPSLLASIRAEFGDFFDPCPYPLPEGARHVSGSPRGCGMLTKEQTAELKRIADETGGAFAEACRDPNVTKEDYDKLREQYSVAQRRYHESMGY